MTMEKRFDHIDQVRGIMILWMLIVHISLNYGFITYGEAFPEFSIFSWMSFFMVPFYFFSGYFFKPSIGFKDFLSKKTFSLLFPYVVYTLLGGVIYNISLLLREHSVSLNLLSPLIPSGMPFYNTPMWFFISLFSVNVLYYVIQRISPKYVTHCIVLACFLIAWAIEGDAGFQILMHRPLFLGIVYFHLGYIFRNHVKLDLRLSVACLICYLLINIFAPQCLWFDRNLLAQGCYPLNAIFSLSETLCFFYLFSRWRMPNPIGGPLKILGRYSLVVFATHRPILNYIYEPAAFYLWPDIDYPFFLLAAIVFLLLTAWGIFLIAKWIHPRLAGC